MKKRLFTLALALLFCISLAPQVTHAGGFTWNGGNDPNCQHE